MNVVLVIAIEERNKLKRQLAQTGHLWAVEEMLDEMTSGIRDTHTITFLEWLAVAAAIRVYKEATQWGIETTFGDAVDYLTHWASMRFGRPAPSVIVETVGF